MKEISDMMPMQFDIDIDINSPIEEEEESSDKVKAKAFLEEMSKKFSGLELVSGSRVENLPEYIESKYGKEGTLRYKFGKFLMQKFGLKPAKDVLLFLSCTSASRVVIATAGAGKTTSIHVDIVLNRIIDQIMGRGLLEPLPVKGTGVSVPRVLFLNYNKHNTFGVVEKQKSLVDRVNSIFAKDKDFKKLSFDIESTTVHAFCRKWLANTSIGEINPMAEEESQKIWESIINPRWKKFYGAESEPCKHTILSELYTYMVEGMYSFEELFQTAKFIDTGLKEDFARACLKKYGEMKKLMSIFDFSDYLISMNELLDSDEEFRHRLQSRYSLIIADENQDFTAIMNNLLTRIHNPDLNRLVIVGDPDQSIYEFRGVSPFNMVDVYSKLKDASLLGFDTNYRCGDKIVEGAKKILALNKLRFQKPIHTVNSGGVIRSIVADQTQTIRFVLEHAKSHSDNLKEIVVAYRNNSSVNLLAEELFYEHIPFNILDTRRPFNNPVFRHIMGFLESLRAKNSESLNKDLYRFLPCKKEAWYAILNQNSDLGHVNVLSLEVPEQLQSSMQIIRSIALNLNRPVCEFVNDIFYLYKRMYFDSFIFLQDDKTKSEFSLYFDRAYKFFNRPMSFEMLCSDLQRNENNPFGLTLSTFHGLKGLEFDTVIAIDMQESVTPDEDSLYNSYPPITAAMTVESENRLAYVLVTRARKNLYLLHKREGASSYVHLLTDSDESTDKVNTCMDIDVSELSTDKSKLDYIAKVLGRRG